MINVGGAIIVMMLNPYEVKEEVVYQADPSLVQAVQNTKEKLHAVGRHHMGRIVRIQTIDGQMLEGTIVNVDRGILYLQVSPGLHYLHYPRQFYNPVILPLVLYELLVITLLYT